MATRNENPIPYMAVHVGMMLKPELEERGIRQSEFAKMLGIQPSHVSEVLKGKRPLTADMALKIEESLGIQASILMSAQAKYECDLLAIQKRGVEEQKALNEFGEYDKVVDTQFLIKAFGIVASSISSKLDEFKQRCRSNSAAEMQVMFATSKFRRSDNLNVDMRMVNTWELIARDKVRNDKVEGVYDPNKNIELAQKLRVVFMDNRNTMQRITRILCEYGIKFTECKTKLAHTKIDGYSYTEDGIPCIIVTNRYDKIDSLAFNVLHELGHLNSTPTKAHINVEDYSKDNPEEKEADLFANNILIPSAIWKRSPEARMNARDIQRKFTAWASKEGINKWIVLGRVSYETGIYAFRDPLKTRRIA